MPFGSIPVERSSLEALFGALERAGARYLVAGGLADRLERIRRALRSGD
jgi:hypothetical protein